KKPAERIRRASLLLGDIGETARLAAEDRLSEARIIPFRAVKVMLASAEETAEAVWERMSCPADDGNNTDAGASAADGCTRTVWVEDKCDGIRCQLHKVGQRVALYSRDLKEVTMTFPELAEGARQIPSDIIFDGEIVAMRDDEVLPFAELQK